MGTCLLETAFSMDMSSIKFGPGVTSEVGREMKRLGCRRVITLMRQIGMSNGLAALGYTAADADALAKGALPQHRVIKLSPRPVDESDLKQLFLDSLTLW